MSDFTQNLHFDTLKIRGAYDSNDHNYAVNVPIYQTAAFDFGDEARGERLFFSEEVGFLYSRIGNPTVDVFERRIAELHNAAGAVAFSSGIAAITNTLFQVGAGGEILTTYQLYGGTVDSFKKIYPDYGIQVKYSEDINNLEIVEKEITENTKAIYVESVSNPNTDVADLEGLAEVAHRHGIPLIVDNTLVTPYLLNPFEYGADIVIYSATKNLTGHGNVIAGVVVEKGGFDWGNGKFKGFTESHYTLRDRSTGKERSFLEAFPEFPFSARLRMIGLNLFGATLGAFDAYLAILGLETLSERLEKQQRNVEKLISFLQSNEHVSWVKYPTLREGKQKELAEKYLTKGAGNLFAFGLKGTEEQKNEFLDSLKLFSFHVNIGDSRSLIVNSPQTTHSELTDEELQKAELGKDLIRVSVGLENAEDLIADLKQSIEKVYDGKTETSAA